MMLYLSEASQYGDLRTVTLIDLSGNCGLLCSDGPTRTTLGAGMGEK